MLPLNAPATGSNAQNTAKMLTGRWICSGPMGSRTMSFEMVRNNSWMRQTSSDGVDYYRYDSASAKWIGMEMNNDGSYMVMQGVPVAGGVNFTQVYLSRGALFEYRQRSANTFTTVEHMTTSGKQRTATVRCNKT